MTTFLHGRVRPAGRYTRRAHDFGLDSAAHDLRRHAELTTHEEDVSAEQSPSEQDARVQDPHAHQGWPSHPGPASGQGSGPAVGLSRESATFAVVFTASSVESRGSADGESESRRRGYGMLRRSSDFRTVLDEGRRLTGKRIVLYVRPRDQGIQVGFVTGRGLGGAVQRNGIRRRLREAWRAVSPLLRDGLDIVVVARPQAAGAKTAELRGEMEALLASEGVAQT